jgi:ketosteroid isomerase-like protein
VSAALNKALVQRILAAYAQSDLTPLLEAIHPDIVWTSSAPSEHYGFAGRHTGRAGTLAGMAKIATDYQLNHYAVSELVAEGDVVWMTAQVDFTHRRSSTRLRFPLVSRWHIVEGKIRSLTEYFDSASLLIQQGALAAVKIA